MSAIGHQSQNRPLICEYSLETTPAPVPVVSYSYSFGSPISFGDVDVQGVVEIAGTIVFVVCVGAAVYYCGPTVLFAILEYLAMTQAAPVMKYSSSH